MSPLPQPGWWKRLRHSRGFGVHSPSAYRFIREVLCERLPYYGYEKIDPLAARWPSGRRSLRLLLRLLARFNPQQVALCVPPHMQEAAAATVAAACPRAAAGAPAPHATFWVVCGCAADEAGMAAAAARRGAAIYLPQPCSEGDNRLLLELQGLPCGHCFVNGSGALVFAGDHNAPRERFDVRF